MSGKIERTEPLTVLSDLSKPFFSYVQAQKCQCSSKNLTTQQQPPQVDYSYQKSNKNDLINEHVPTEQEHRKQWTLQQEKLLVKLHNLKGNRWVQISLILNQLYLYNRRSDNSVKNHFHSKLRRGARKINSYIDQEQKGCFKIIRNNLLAKIVQACDGVTVNNLHEKIQRAVLAYEIKNFIFSASDFQDDLFNQSHKECIKLALLKIKEFQALLTSKPKFSKIDSGIRYKGKEIKTLIKENQIREKQKNQKFQKRQTQQTIKQQEENRIEYSHQNIQGNLYQEIPLYYTFGQQHMSYPFFQLPVMPYPYQSFPSSSPFLPIEEYPTQSTITYLPQNIASQNRGNALYSLNS